MSAWVHLHLPRLRSGEEAMISVKVPGQRIEYRNVVCMANASFVVSEAGRQRCLREGVRNVHAWVVGDVTADAIAPLKNLPLIEREIDNMRRAVYCPFKGGTFVDTETLEPVLSADHVLMIGKTVFYRNEG